MVAILVAIGLPIGVFAARPAAGAPRAPEFGPADGMHVEVVGTARGGYAARIYDGGTFVASRGLQRPWDLTASVGQAPDAQLLNRYTDYTYDSTTATLALSGAVNTVDGVKLTRRETYRFINSQVILASLSIESTGPVRVWFSPYTSFHPGWRPLWLGGFSSHYDSPVSGGDATDASPIPVLGALGGGHIYGVESGSTWDYPIPGYDSPHLRIRGSRLAAPQVGTPSNPITLSPNRTESWSSVFFRSAPSRYSMALQGEVAMAEALGFTTKNSPGATEVPGRLRGGRLQRAPRGLVRTAMADFGLIDRATAYWEGETAINGSKAMVPSMYYAPGTYMRDSFWTMLALGRRQAAAMEPSIFQSFTRSIPTDGPDAGHVPVAIGGPLFPDESSALYLIRMYYDVDVLHLRVANKVVAGTVLQYILRHQVVKGAFVTVAPARYGGHADISPDSWLDGYLYPSGRVDGYDQGVYVVALEAAQRLGLAVSAGQLQAAEETYRSLYDPSVGYIPWLSGTTYKSPDVLVGEALSLLLFKKALLSNAVVTNTLHHQSWTPYGMKVLAQANGSYVPAGRFTTLQQNKAGQVVAVDEPGGWYQNGGSWFLYEYLAEYAAARQGDPGAKKMMARSIEDEVAVTPMLKEFKLTTGRGGYSYPPGSSALVRQGYGWNSAEVAFAASLESG